MDAGFPRSVEDDFPGMHDEFDAVAYHYGNMQKRSTRYSCGSSVCNFFTCSNKTWL